MTKSAMLRILSPRLNEKTFCASLFVLSLLPLSGLAVHAQKARLTAPVLASTARTSSVGSDVTATTSSTSGVGFGTVNIGRTSAASTLTFSFTSPGNGVSVTVLTLGAKNQDFIDTGAGSCTTNGAGHTYAVGDTCSVVVTYTPRFNGPRNGAVLLANGSSQVAIGYIYGTGYGPQIGYLPGIQSNLGPGFSGPNGVAIDGSGNVYVTSIGLDSVEEFVVADGSIKTLGSGFFLPGGVALDGAGNVYVADTYNDAIKEILATDGSVVTLGSGFSTPSSVAVDGSGNVYVADIGNNVVKEIVAADGSIRTLGSGFNAPTGVAVDGAGNVYVSSLDDGTVKEIVAATGSVKTIGTGFSLPRDVAVDGIGNVYVTDTYNNAVAKISGTDGSVHNVGSGFNIPNGVAVDGRGNVYVADYNNNRVVLEDFTTAPSLNFATPTQVETTDATDGPQSFTIENIGSAPLSLAPTAGGTNPALTTGFSLANGGGTTCSSVVGTSLSATPLASNASCVYAVNFTPVTDGTVQGTLTLTDNNLSAFGTGLPSNQVVLMNGTGIGTPIILVTGSLQAGYVGLSYSTSFAAAGGIAPYTFSAMGLPPGLTLATSGSLTGTLTTAGTYTIVVTATDVNGYTGSASFPLTVGSSAPDFQFAIVGTPPQNLTAGGSAQYLLSVSPANGSFPYPVSFTVAGLPAGYREIFSPAAVTPGSNTVQTQMTVQSNTTFALQKPRTGLYGVMAAFFLLPLMIGSKIRRRLPRALLSVLLLSGAMAATVGLTGCVGTQITPATYNVVVTATGAGHQHSVQIMLKVQP